MKEQDDFLLDDNKMGSELTPKAMSDLKITASWLSYIGIFGGVVIGLMFVGTFISMFYLMGNGLSYPGTMYLGLLFVMGFFALLFYMSILLYQYGNALKRFMITGKYYELEEAFEKQKIYWIVGGVSATAVVGLYLVVILLGALMGT